MSKVKYMDLQEFYDLGLLQEINRLLLHPMGLALEMVFDDEDNAVEFGGVWDYRDDPDGMIFGDEIVNNPRFNEKVEKAEELFLAKKDSRMKNFGYHIQLPKVKV